MSGPACSLKVFPKAANALGSTLVHKCFTKSLHPYEFGTKIMDDTVRQFLDYKLKHSHNQPINQATGNSDNLHAFPPPATLLTFQFSPTYTLGRREKGTLTADLESQLSNNGKAQVIQTFRGGQTTFHGPGQLVAYPIIDLRAFRTSNSSNGTSDLSDSKNAGLPVRCYVELLERTVIKTLANAYGLDGAQTTENTGVWMDPDHKICAMGIHVRRHVTSHGIGLNVKTDTQWFDRIVACGLPDKSTTSIEKELEKRKKESNGKGLENVDMSMEYAAHSFAKELAEALNLQLEEEFL